MRILLVAALCGAAVLAVASTGYAYRTRAIAIRGWQEVENVRNQKDVALRSVILGQAGVDARETDLNSIVLGVRDYLYRMNKFGDAGEAIRDPAVRFATIGLPGSDNKCGGLSTIFAWALDKLGIPARTVQLADAGYLAAGPQRDNHVTVEAYLDGKWEISDPLFNTSFDCSDGTRRLSIPEARACFESGHELVPILGKSQDGQWTLAKLGHPYKTYLAAYDRRPYSGNGITVKMESFPTDDWLAKAEAANAAATSLGQPAIN